MASRTINFEPTRVESVARDIKEYFRANPNAGDTAEGIANWWVANQRLKNPARLVRKALELLEAKGEVHKRIYNGQEIYVREKAH